MNSGNPLPGSNSHNGDSTEAADRAGGQQVRDIQEIIAKLESVTKRLAHPLRTLPAPRDAESPAGPEVPPGSPNP